jgi:hypothetical protein
VRQYTLGLNGDGDSVLQPDLGYTSIDADFPAYIGGRTVWPGLGDEVTDANRGLSEQQKRFKKEMILAVAKVTAVQMGISIVMMCIPVIGWLLAAINALVSLIVGDIMKKRLKKVMDGIKTEIQDYQKAAQIQVHEHEEQAVQSVWSAATALAASGESLDGLGNLWDDIKGTAKRVVHSVVQFHNAPVKIIGRGVIKGVRNFAHVVHDTKMEKRLKNKEAAWDEEIDRTTKHATAALTDAKTAVEDAKHAVRIVTGEEQVRVAKEKGALLVAKAKAQIDASTASVIAAMQTAEYRANLTRNLAKAIRGDPAITSDAQYFAGKEAAYAAANGVPTDSIVPTVQPSSGGLVAVAAAVGAYFMLR